jgi:PKHD-type hydroxylase
MGWNLIDENYANEPFVYVKNAFSDDEISEIIELGKAETLNFGGTDGLDTSDMRSSKISWIKVNENTEKYFRKLVDLVTGLNDRFYRFNLSTIEDLQYSEYDSSYSGYYGTHSDDGYKQMLFRKVSFSIQLSDPTEYEGGDLRFYRHSTTKFVECPKDKGTLILFPSWTIHEVTPVTTGTRYSLVSWVNGPRWK